MDFIIILFFVIVFINAAAKKGSERKEQEDTKESRNRENSPVSRKLQRPTSMHDVERVMHEFKSRARDKARQIEEHRYQKSEQFRKTQEQEERRRREAQEQRKESAERRKKLEEQKERQQREQARKAQEERDKLASMKASRIKSEPLTVDFFAENTDFTVDRQTIGELGRNPARQDTVEERSSSFHLSDYLDPLTASFYPGNQKEEREDGFCVDDYLFPTLAPFYPEVDEALYRSDLI